jgi:hypothetical protein
MEVELVAEHALLRATSRLANPSFDVPRHRAMHVAVSVGVPPPEVDVQHLTRDVVRVQSIRTLFHEREAAKPFEELVRVIATDHVGEQRLGRDANVRARFERESVTCARHRLDELTKEDSHDVGHLPRPELGVCSDSREHIGDERQRERMSMREAEHRLVLRFRDAPLEQERPTLLRPQIPKRNDASQRAPGDVGSPRRVRRVPARNNHDASIGQLREDCLAQPRVEGRELFVRVDQQHGWRAVRDLVERSLVLNSPRCCQRAQKTRGRRLDAVAIEEDRVSLCRSSKSRTLAKERRLADAPRPVDVEDGELRVIGEQH